MTSAAIADWDMSPYFPEFEGEVYRGFKDSLAEDVAAIRKEIGDHPEALDSDSLDRWVARLASLEELSTRSAHLGGYLGCIGAADSKNEAIQRETAAAARARVELQKCFLALQAVMRNVEDALFEELRDAEALADGGYFLDRLRHSAKYRMTPDLEMLNSELDVDGLGAWGRLYDRVSGTLEFELAAPGKPVERRPVAITRSLLEHPDPQVRRAALIGSNAAWESMGEVVASSLNAIATSRGTSGATTTGS